ncbi:MAG: glycosyltransferase family 2 protein [Planctomycetes bacterium]|nr:glycosyltransferase family 2 protein [Planctomycetota bacterium]
MTAARARALVIDASEWFHDPAWRQHVTRRHWRRLPARAAVVVRLALQELAAVAPAARATFVVPASLLRHDAALLAALGQAGHEVALAASPEATVDELVTDREALEAALRRRVFGVGGVGAAVAAAAGFAYVVAEGEGFVAWRLDGGQPRLVGLPKRVFANHYDRQHEAAAALRAFAGAADGTLAAARGLDTGASPLPPRARPAPPPAVPARADAPRLAIVVPLKDEEHGLDALLVELDAVKGRLADVARCEFVFVDDGSSDRTWPLLQQLAGTRADSRLVRHPHNRGVAAAIRTGLLATDAPLAASIDGDLSYDPMELRAMLARLDEADVVTASPYHPAGGVRNVPGWRLLLSRTLSAAYRLLLRRPIRTWTACFRVYRREVVSPLPLVHEGFLGTAELLVRVLRRGGRVVEHPCVLEARLFGFSKMRVLRTIRGHLRLLWQVARGRIT